MNLSALTLSAWVKPAIAPPVQGTIISKWAAFSSSLADYNLVLFSNLRMQLGVSDHVSGRSLISTNSLVVDRWHHIIATIDSSGLGTVFIDGVLQARGTVYPLVPPSTEIVRIGQMVAANGGIVDTFNGSIDDVRFYNRALSASEIEQLYAHEVQLVCVPHAATATAQIVNGFFVGATITDGGCGYTNAPLVSVVGSGTGATAVAVIENGIVIRIDVTNPGNGYSSDTEVRIASPPFMPWLEVGVSKVKVTQHVVMGKDYVLEASTDLANWSQVGTQFTAENEVTVQEFDVDVAGRFFRIREVP
jgi:hypothetical protein